MIGNEGAKRAAERVTRLDIGELKPPEKLSNGFLRADAFMTRSGVFNYRNSDGTMRREYRPAEEVFHADSLASLKMMPVTDDHPPQLLTADNASSYQRGAVGESVRKDGDKVAGPIVVTDGDLIAKMERGDAVQCSAGYTCDMEWSSGTSPTGERYDAIQRNIRYNHLAVLPRGRAGSDVRVRMDAANLAVVLDQPPTPSQQVPQEKPVHKIHLDGIDVEVGNEQAAQAFTKLQGQVSTARKDAADAASKVEAMQAKLDAAVAETERVKKDAAEAPAKIRAELAARAGLETQARKVLGDKVKFDGVSDKDLRLKVLAKLAPAAKFDAKSDEYLAARFDAEVERADAFPPKKDEDEDEESDDGDERKDGGRMDATAAREKMMKSNRELWKRQAGARLDESHNVRIAK